LSLGSSIAQPDHGIALPPHVAMSGCQTLVTAWFAYASHARWRSAGTWSWHQS